MELIKENFTMILTTLTLISHILFALLIVGMIASRGFKDFVHSFVTKNILVLIFLLSSLATLSSLIYSNVIGFPPCELCWAQRIFMYPIVLISFFAMVKKTYSMVKLVLGLSSIGALIALYHSLTHFGLGDGLLECTSALGDCGKLYVFEYGYISIPLMSLTIFTYLITISLIYLRSNNVRG